MCLTFAVPDLHGRLDLLQAALATIEAYPAARRAGTVVFLGDYIDRGPSSAQVLAQLMAGPPQGWRWICLKGNHEAMMALALRDPSRLDWWLGNGGAATLASYRGNKELRSAHLGWIDGLDLIHVDRFRVFVHAGLDASSSLDEQNEDVLLWKRTQREDQGGFAERHVVHGHDPNLDGPLLHEGRTDLDCCAWMTGRRVVGVFDDARPGGPADLIELRAAPA